MPRLRRNDFPGAWHHVMNRAIGGVELFIDDVDRRIFLIEFREALQATSTELHGYCLMSNHYHLLVHTPSGGLSDLMQKSISTFTQKVNSRRGRDGPMFRGRFNSVSPGDDAHLLNMSAYIHLNPVKAGLCLTPDDWEWSSAAAYTGKSPVPHWLRTDRLLDMFGANCAHRSYSAFLMEKISEMGSDPAFEH
jgi:putative transposase